MKLKTEHQNWNNVFAVNKMMQPWLKSSPSRNELLRVVPLLFENDMVGSCVTNAELVMACEGLRRMIKTCPYEEAVETINDLLKMMVKFAPLYEEFKCPNASKPTLYKELQDSIGNVLAALPGEPEVKQQVVNLAVEVNNIPTFQSVVTATYSGPWPVQDALADFFYKTGQPYADLLKSIKEQRSIASAVPEDQVRANAESQVTRRAVALTL